MTENIQIKILFFAKSRELVGEKQTVIEAPALLSARQLLDLLINKFPSISVIAENLVLSLNEDYVDLTEEVISLRQGQSFRMNHIDLTNEKLNVDRITALVTAPSCGAVSVFMGTTRDNFEGKRVVQLEYEAYDSMARKKMEEVCDQIRAQWQVENIAIVHRLGVVPVTESSIIIAVSSPHRKESLEAVSFAIDTLKAMVPIWKKEVYEDTTSDWKANKECAWAANRQT